MPLGKSEKEKDLKGRIKMKNNYIDIGINLINKQFRNEIDDTIKRAVEANVSTMIMTGTSLKNSLESLKIAKKNKGIIYATVGIHPHNAKEFNLNTKRELNELLISPEVVAVGECGLDFDRDFSPRLIQEECFKMHLALAIEIQKPLFLHERAAFNRFIAIVNEYLDELPNGVVHYFTSDKEALKAYLDAGFYIGFTGAISDLKRFNHLKEIVNYVPLDKLMIETDSPFMLPKNIPLTQIDKRNKRRNEPAFLPYVAEIVAKFKKISIAEVAFATTQNAEQFFKI